jgi:hypothetical protein
MLNYGKIKTPWENGKKSLGESPKRKIRGNPLIKILWGNPMVEKSGRKTKKEKFRGKYRKRKFLRNPRARRNRNTSRIPDRNPCSEFMEGNRVEIK